jgi:hypothetical protein
VTEIPGFPLARERRDERYEVHLDNSFTPAFAGGDVYHVDIMWAILGQTRRMTPADRFTWSTYDTLLRLDFVSFAQRCLCELSPRAQFAMNWHIEIIAAIPGTARKGRPSGEMAVRAGKIRRLIINMPPRYLKSLLVSVAFPAWCLGHDPAAQIVCASYAQELADKLSRDCRRIIVSDWFGRIFPTRLSQERQAVSEFETTALGSRLATSVGGVLTGRRMVSKLQLNQ